MKRAHSQPASGDFIIYEDNFGIPAEREPKITGLQTAEPSQDAQRPWKMRRHGSRLLSVLRSLTNSAGSSHMEPFSPSPSPSTISDYSRKEMSKKLSLSFLRMTAPQPTVVHRMQAKGRPSIRSLEKEVAENLAQEVSLSTSGETSGTSGKSSGPGNNSTGMTSLDSKISQSTKAKSPHSQEKRILVKQGLVDDVVELALTPIQEIVMELEPLPVPTVLTVEKAAAAKIFFECHYNGLFSNNPSARTIRLHELEGSLYADESMSAFEREEKRLAWATRETNYLREIRGMKSRGTSPAKPRHQWASQYEVIKVLGKGSFGVVRLVRERERSEASVDGKGERKQREVFAMKVIRKSDMLRNSQEGHLRAERDFLVSSEGSRWIVPLVASFQDESNLYLVMEYMPGGDFLGLLIRDNTLSEAVAKWYIAEMILCIEEAHSLHWIHRDVKPDNFLISASGHLKISDFGLAFDGHWSHDQGYYNNHRYSLLSKLGINVEGDSIDKKEGQTIAQAMKIAQQVTGRKDRHEKKSSASQDGEGVLNWRNRTGNRTLARSVVGTSQYMAPEVVRGELYDARCDWWSVAVILYECLYGHTPFLAEEGGRAQTKLNILNHKTTFSFPSNPPVSHRCHDLLRKIIQEKSDRICSKRYKTKDVTTLNRDAVGRYVYPHDAEDIKSHRWFKNIPWDRMHLMTPPFVPAIKSLEDTHYFDEEEPISDFSSSQDEQRKMQPPTEEEVEKALRSFNREIQILARSYVVSAYDTVRLRKIEKEIDGFTMCEEQKEYLRRFVKEYGRKEKKRPRDRLLRDREFAGKVLEARKKGAFLGYSYRRIRTGRGSIGVARGVNIAASGKGRSKIWQRGKISIA